MSYPEDKTTDVESVLDLLQSLNPSFTWTITIKRERYADYCVFSATAESSEGTQVLKFLIKQPLTSERAQGGLSRSESEKQNQRKELEKLKTIKTSKAIGDEYQYTFSGI